MAKKKDAIVEEAPGARVEDAPTFKQLEIVLMGDKPGYTFTGQWTGKDIQIVASLLKREYVKHQRDLRRQPIS